MFENKHKNTVFLCFGIAAVQISLVRLLKILKSGIAPA